MKNIILLFICNILVISISFAQAPIPHTQTIEGRILDKETQSPVAGAIIFIEDTYPVISTQSDLDGHFGLQNIPVGRHTLKAQKKGYSTFYTDNLLVRSTKEVYLEIAIKKALSAEQNTGVINDYRENVPLNEASVVSTRSFTVEETRRYAGSIYDIGRMALCFPSIQGYEANESDMIIRGNSATGVLYRLEGLDLQSAGHFAWPLSVNGAISALSISLLDDSDISTGAFAAEYGNASSGVVDMNFRTGNLNHKEYTFRLGLFGIDFATEGPIKKGSSSYLVNYRYSTLGILSNMGVQVVRENVNNTFQDLSFNTTFESKNKKNRLQFFGLGGLSSGKWSVKDSSKWVTRQDYFKINYNTIIGNIGLNYHHLINTQSYLKILIGATYNQISNERDNGLFNYTQIENHKYYIQQYTLSGTYSKRFNDLIRLKTGISGHGMLFNLHYKSYDYQNATHNTLVNTNGLKMTYWLQGYLQTSLNFSHRLNLNLGVHGLGLGLNKTYSIEPRSSLQYKLFKKTRLNLSYGIYGKILPIGTYFYQNEQGKQLNKKLDIPKAHHFVFNVRQLLKQDMSLQLELWYQKHFHQPIGAENNSTYFLFNQRFEYADRALSSSGTGQNYGIDLMFEKAFRNDFFVLMSGSLFRSFYHNAEGTKYRTRYDNLFTSAATIGREISFKDHSYLSIGLRILANGGFRHSPVDTALTNQFQLVFVDNSKPYTLGQSNLKSPFYYRSDLRIAYRKDWEKYSITISLDIQNITNNRKNAFQQIYDIQKQVPVFRYEGGILPVLNMQLDF